MAQAERNVAERCMAAGLDPARLPRHVGIIMDGNGRWATRRGWWRGQGHRQGAAAVRTITTRGVELGLHRLTLYAFSSENWQRPDREVAMLMDLLDEFLRDELPTLLANGVKLEAIGHLHRLHEKPRASLERCLAATREATGMTLCLALSYGGRDELADAARAIARRVQAGELSAEQISPATLAAHLYAPHAAPVDLIIRTAGEQRVSNFLIYQAAYAEYVSHPAWWPDFDAAAFDDCLRQFQQRQRRFGGVEQQGAPAER